VIARDPLGRVPDERTRSYLDATGGNPFLATRIIDNVARSTARGEPTRLPASSPRRSRADSPASPVRHASWWSWSRSPVGRCPYAMRSP
jgi:hypothetical protein